MSSNDFLEFDDDSQGPDGSSGRSPFLLLAAILIIVLILASLGTVFLLSQRNQGSGEQAAAIEATNAVIAVTNTAVAETVAAMATEQAQPATETPTPSPAVTDIPTETPTVSATDTPVVIAEITVDTGTVVTSVVTIEGGTIVTSVVTIEAGGTITPTGIVTGDNITPIATFATGSDNALPQTGLDTWAAALLAVFFIGLFVAARRLRSS